MDSMTVCQISDLHVRLPGQLSYGVVDCARMLRGAVAEILRLPQQPDAVVATGDLMHSGSAQEYAHLRELLAPLPMPLYLLPGNHDERAALQAAFSDHGYLRQSGTFVQYAIEDWPLRIVALDTVVPGSDAGALCDQRLAWLDATLARAPDQPTLVIMHHPPFETLISHMDAIGLDGAQAFADVIRRHPQVERVLCGHLHRSIQARVGGTLSSTCPSTAHQLGLDLAPGARSFFRMEPPGLQLHAWRRGAAVVTHTVVIGEYPGPYPFREPAN